MLAFRISKYISILNGLGTSGSKGLELGSISLGPRCGVSTRLEIKDGLTVTTDTKEVPISRGIPDFFLAACQVV
ncbi:hypothetical protein RCL_jg1620.t1 [Rhizophagus clarus]|uniref:Uncharacterized protein n=1 Tax=Rhizophagus clarus TaxID=94130 RepID=A0A8H3QJ71_9GLOM|nr:hypothetical protein RCL_jg1620.t1 [Rhizophagus clarus]